MPPLARALYRLRRRRERIFGDGLFSDPNWDLLLDLYAAEKASQCVCITSACLATAVPTTSALRCVKLLETQGLIVREADRKDTRRTHLRLSAGAMRGMDALFLDLRQQIDLGGSDPGVMLR